MDGGIPPVKLFVSKPNTFNINSEVNIFGIFPDNLLTLKLMSHCFEQLVMLDGISPVNELL